MTPFGFPVDPEVYMIIAVSSGPGISPKNKYKWLNIAAFTGD